MFSPSTIGAEKSQISANAAIDYSLPFQSVGKLFTARIASAYMSTVNDWKESSFSRTIPQDVDLSSFTVSASAADNYGTDFALWLTIIDNYGRYLYNSGWKTGGINYEYIPMYEDTSSITVYFRIRYLDEQGTNPPSPSMFTAVQCQINFNQYVQTSEETALPPDWLATTTAENTPIIDTSTTVVSVPDDITTTVAPETVEQYLTLPAKVHSALLFMLDIVGRLLRLKYVTPAICFGLLVALAGWLLH